VVIDLFDKHHVGQQSRDIGGIKIAPRRRNAALQLAAPNLI
jgi:hypothetical protein